MSEREDLERGDDLELGPDDECWACPCGRYEIWDTPELVAQARAKHEAECDGARQ